MCKNEDAAARLMPIENQRYDGRSREFKSADRSKGIVSDPLSYREEVVERTGSKET